MDGFRLAEIVGSSNADEVLANIGTKEFQRWQAYFKVRESEAWEIAGHIAAAAWNAALLVSGHSEEVKRKLLREPDAFIPAHKQITRPVATRSPEQDAAALAAALEASFGPRV